MIFDYGSESNNIYIVLHGGVNVLIPSSSLIDINEDEEIEAKVLCLAYCIQNFDIIMWSVMTYEVEYQKYFDIK